MTRVHFRGLACFRFTKINFPIQTANFFLDHIFGDLRSYACLTSIFNGTSLVELFILLKALFFSCSYNYFLSTDRKNCIKNTNVRARKSLQSHMESLSGNNKNCYLFLRDWVTSVSVVDSTRDKLFLWKKTATYFNRFAYYRFQFWQGCKF